MRKIKILWVTNTLGCGGAERQISNMFSAISRQYHIDVLYYKELYNHFKSDIRENNLIFMDKQKMGRFKFLLKTARLIKKNRYDIVYAFGGSSANIYGRICGIMAGAPVIIGAMLGKKHFSNPKSKLINSLLNIFSNYWTVNNIDLIPILKKDLKFISQKNIVLIPNGFTDAHNIDYKTDEVTEYDILKENKFVIAAVGRLEPVKNYEMLVAAAAKILQGHQNVMFWLAGEGSLYEKLKGLIEEYNISDRFLLLGYKNDIDVLLSRCDLFVQTSNTEGSPNTLSEAMRAQKPVISTKSTNLDKFIDDSKNGFRVEVGDKDGFVDAIKKILSFDSERLADMGKHSFGMFRKSFLLSNAAQEMDLFYKKCLAEKSVKIEKFYH